MTHQVQIETTPASLKKPVRSFYLSWIFLTSLCVPIAFIISLIVLKLITSIVGDFVYVNGVRHITEDYLAMYAFVPMVSLLTGAVQYELLRQYLSRMGWWVPATVAGWLLGILLVGLPGWLGRTNTPINDQDLIFLVMGLAIGTAQWLLLRRRLARAGWWIAANALGWLLLGLIIPGNSLDQFGLLILGFLPACATAVMLALQMNWVPSTG